MLSPNSIAFIGKYSIIRQGIKNCKQMGFKGEIYAVHQTRTEIEGIPCYKSISELPSTPDAAYLAIRGERTVQALKDLNILGVSGCVCYAAGFSETGNTKLQNELIEAAGEMAVVGPNCYGVINFLDQVPLWPDRHGGEALDRGVAIISQSGNMSLNLTMTDRSLPVAYVISVGNQAVLDIANYIEVMCEDPRVTAIGVHIEGLDHIEAFIRAAKKALEKGIPIVAFKTGVSEIGSKLTLSHTSSLAGADDLYDALFERLNICRVNSLAAFLEALKLFSIGSKLKGKKLGVLTCSGGESTVVADLVAEYGFTLPDLEAKQKKFISALLTTFEHITNPLDYNTSVWGKEAELTECFTEFMKGPFDVTLLVLDMLEMEKGNVQPWIASCNAIIKARKKTLVPTIVTSILPEGIPASFRKKLITNGITPLQGITEAFEALRVVTAYWKKAHHYRSFEKIPSQLLLPSVPLNENSTMSLNEWKGKQEIALYGIKIPHGKLVTPTDDQPLITEKMQPPFVVKRVSSAIVHKTDVGAVQLRLQNEQEVREAINDMNNHLIHISELENKYLVEEMVTNAVAELNIGIKRDEQFGLALVISMGGELVNLLNDSIPLLLPTTREEVKEALFSLEGIKLLTGYRGRPKGDIDAVIDVAMSIATYAEINRNTILEMDINPLLVMPKGEGAIAVDAYIRVANELEQQGLDVL